MLFVLLSMTMLAQTPNPTPIPIAPRADVDASDVRATLDKEPVTFGRVAMLIVEVPHDANQTAVLPKEFPSTDTLSHVGRIARTQEKRGAGIVDIFRIPLLVLDVAPNATPAFDVTLSTGATSTVVHVQPVSFTVATEPLPEEADDAEPELKKGNVLEGHAPFIGFSVIDARPFIALLILLCLAIILWMLIKLIRAWKKRNMASAVVVKRPAHEIALERLQTLEKGDLLLRGDVPTFVEKLMDDVLRDYVTARFALSADTKTTRELIASLLQMKPTDVDVDITQVESLLQDADRMKFARAQLTSPQATDMAGRVRRFVVDTQQRPAPTTEKP
jgi:hypothetical protein